MLSRSLLSAEQPVPETPHFILGPLTTLSLPPDPSSITSPWNFPPQCMNNHLDAPHKIMLICVTLLQRRRPVGTLMQHAMHQNYADFSLCDVPTRAERLAMALARKVPAPKPGANWRMVSWNALRVFSNSHLAWPRSKACSHLQNSLRSSTHTPPFMLAARQNVQECKGRPKHYFGSWITTCHCLSI